MGDWAEYEFILPDGSRRYEMIDLSVPARPQVWSFKRMSGAVLAWPLAKSRAEPQYRQRLIRRLQQRKQPQA